MWPEDSETQGQGWGRRDLQWDDTEGDRRWGA